MAFMVGIFHSAHARVGVMAFMVGIFHSAHARVGITVWIDDEIEVILVVRQARLLTPDFSTLPPNGAAFDDAYPPQVVLSHLRLPGVILSPLAVFQIGDAFASLHGGCLFIAYFTTNTSGIQTAAFA